MPLAVITGDDAEPEQVPQHPAFKVPGIADQAGSRPGAGLQSDSGKFALASVKAPSGMQRESRENDQQRRRAQYADLWRKPRSAGIGIPARQGSDQLIAFFEVTGGDASNPPCLSGRSHWPWPRAIPQELPPATPAMMGSAQGGPTGSAFNRVSLNPPIQIARSPSRMRRHSPSPPAPLDPNRRDG